MAQLETFFDERFFAELGKAADVERLAPKLINAALPILERALKSAYGPYQLARKLKLVKAKAAKNGGYIGTITMKGNSGQYYIKGKKRYPLSNAGLAVFLEFGTAAHGNFPARPPGGYISKAVAASEEAIKAEMQKTFEAEMEALRL